MNYWNALTFIAPENTVDAVADLLMDAGALSVDVADADAGSAAEQALFREPNERSPERWNNNQICALFSSDQDADSLRVLAVACGNACDFSPKNLTVSKLDDADWVRLTQSQFAPIEITPTLWIVPTWCEVPKNKALNLVLDPGLAFGTGSHPTTRLCLRWLVALADAGILNGADVLDYGCGSGILGIAAERLGAANVVATDIDLQALQVAKENALSNGATRAQWLAPAQINAAQQFPIVVANILANPLCVLAPMLSQHIAPTGRIALAGILSEQVEKVTQAYAPWVTLTSQHTDDGWHLLTGMR